METRELTLVSDYDGLTLHGTMVRPSSPHYVAIIVHGMVEHRGRYTDLIQFLYDHNIAAVIFDHRGHGESVSTLDDLGYFNDADGIAIIADLKMIIDHVHRWFDHLPLIIIAHSMGTLISRVYCKQYSNSIDALILSGSPSANGLVDVAIGLTKGLLMIHDDHYRSYFMQRLVFGTYAKAFSQDPSTNGWLCSNPQVVAQYDKDPYCNYVFTLDGFLNLFLLLKRTYSKHGLSMVKTTLPTLFLAGAKDPCIVSYDRFQSAVKKWQNFGFTTVESKIYPSDRHEIFNEKDKYQVYMDVLTFIRTHVIPGVSNESSIA